MEAMEKISLDKDVCNGCNRRAAVNKEFKCCSKCKRTYYCSKECQVSHWKSHKPDCRRLIELKKKALQNHQKREFRLLQEWERQVRNARILASMLFSFFGWNALERLEQEESVVLLRLVFDYNVQNFVPESEPAIVPTDTLVPQFAERLRQQYASIPLPVANQCKLLSVINAEEVPVGSIVPYLLGCTYPTEALPRAGLGTSCSNRWVMPSPCNLPSLSRGLVFGRKTSSRQLTAQSVRARTLGRFLRMRCGLNRLRVVTWHTSLKCTCPWATVLEKSKVLILIL